MDPTRHDEEGTNDDHEGRVIDSGLDNTCGLVENKEIVKAHNGGQHDAKLVVVTLPVMLRDYGTEGDCEQQDCKRQRDQLRRGHHCETRRTNHPAIGLIAVRSVNETRVLRHRS